MLHRSKTYASEVLELLHGFHQPDIPFLDQVRKYSPVDVLLCNRYHQAKVCPNHQRPRIFHGALSRPNCHSRVSSLLQVHIQQPVGDLDSCQVLARFASPLSPRRSRTVFQLPTGRFGLGQVLPNEALSPNQITAMLGECVQGPVEQEPPHAVVAEEFPQTSSTLAVSLDRFFGLAALEKCLSSRK